MTVTDAIGAWPVADDKFWRSESERNHQWVMLMFRFSKDAHQRILLEYSNEYFRRVEEFDRAQALLRAQYHVAIACEALAFAGMTFGELIEVMVDEFQHRKIL